MNTRIMDSPAKRISIAVAIVTGLILLAAAARIFLGSSPSQPANGLKIVAAAHAYTRILRQHKLPIPPSVSLQDLVDKGLLLPADIGSFQGLDANLVLTATNEGPKTVLMRVHLPDGADMVLFGDGSAQEVTR